MKVSVRPAREADLPRVLELLHQIDDSMYPPREEASEAVRLSVFRQIAADPCQHLLVAEADGRIVGSAQLVVIRLGWQRTHYGFSLEPDNG